MKHINFINIVFFLCTASVSISSLAQTDAGKQPRQSYTNHKPLAHHQVALEVLAASEAWIQAFNKGQSQVCVSGYRSDAVLRAKPFGLKKGIKAIKEFWTSFLNSGAANLVYTQVSIGVINEKTALLSANWQMNVGEGHIYQEKWVKENNRWLLAYDDFEVLKKYKRPISYTLNPVTSHKALAQAIKASANWIQGFNQQNAQVCGKGYAKNATMHGVPLAYIYDQKSIETFWAGLIKQGARNLTYHQPKFTAQTDHTVILSAQWSMNIGEGEIYQEKWIKQANGWVLNYDEFELLKKYL
ncbi:hypothetical protein BKI52_10630 [marine bacterium AO1-C]|nr:hypothetical protein BKI52_10630 [marine bacterium AO1-C]